MRRLRRFLSNAQSRVVKSLYDHNPGENIVIPIKQPTSTCYHKKNPRGCLSCAREAKCDHLLGYDILDHPVIKSKIANNQPIPDKYLYCPLCGGKL